MKIFLTILFLIILTGTGNAEQKIIEIEIRGEVPHISFSERVHYNVQQKKIEIEQSEGLPTSRSISLETKKREAFLSAFFMGLRSISDGIAEMIKNTTIEIKGKDTDTSLFITGRETVGDFELDWQSIIENAGLKDDLINIKFKGQLFVIKMAELISPPIDFITLIDWNNIPKSIGGVEISNLRWYKDEEVFAMKLSYNYDPAKTKHERKEIKALDFEFQKDNSGNLVFKTITIDGIAHGGGTDTPDAMQGKALKIALRNAVEKVNGVFIQGLTEVEGSRLTKDEIISQTMGIANVLDRKFNPRFTSSGGFEVVCTVIAQVPLVRIVPR